MSLATRCSACGIAFRIVQDQLKVSEGWVRCGRCGEIFNALESLFDLEREAAPGSVADAADAPVSVAGVAGAAAGAVGAAQTVEPTAPQDESALPATARGADFPTPEPAGASAGDLAPSVALAADSAARVTPAVRDIQTPAAADAPASRDVDFQSARALDTALTGPPPAAARAGDPGRPDFADAEFEPTPSIDDNPAAPPNTHHPAAFTVASETPHPSPAPGLSPGFVRDAWRHGSQRSPAARAVFIGAACALAIGLLLQTFHHFRDRIAAQWPATQPAFAAWCRTAGCTMQLPRRIDDISVESTALTRAAGPDAFQLALALRNRGPLTLAVPAVDLSLTGPAGQLVARRVLTPQDFRAAASIQPGAELSLQLVLSAAPAQIAGYTVEIFYP